MKKINFGRIIWVIGIFAFLLIILYLVVQYKVKYEWRKPTQYLYFYDCSEEDNINILCTTTNEDNVVNLDKIYSKYKCQNDICPIFDRVIDGGNHLSTLIYSNNKILYNYQSGNILSTSYQDYYPMYNNNTLVNLLVIDKDDLKGLTDLDLNIVLDISYQELGNINENVLTKYSYSEDYLVAKRDDKWGTIKLSDYNIRDPFIYNTLEDLLKANINIK